jgi:hypothetical protein
MAIDREQAAPYGRRTMTTIRSFSAFYYWTYRFPPAA